MKKYTLLIGVVVQIVVVILARLIFTTCISPYELGQLDLAYSLSIATPWLVMFSVLIIGMNKSRLKLGLFVAFSIYLSFQNSLVMQSWFPSRITMSQRIAVDTLSKHLYTAQLQYQAACESDINKNNIGEYGFISQLSAQLDSIAEQASRTDEGGNWTPPLFTGLSTLTDREGLLTSRGYHYQIFLPHETLGMCTSKSTASAALSEKHFLIIAWPEKLNQTGRRIYAITEKGKIITTNSASARAAFIKNPDWKHLYPEEGESFAEIQKKGLSSAWTYLKD